MTSKDLTVILKDIKKKYGNVIKTGQEIIDQRKDYKLISIGPALDVALKGGIREGTWLMLSGAPKSGKEQPLSSIVYTENGPIKMQDIAIGDKVCTPSGALAEVIGVYPQGVKDVYRVYFDDDTYAECGLEHIWKVHKNDRGTKNWQNLTLKDIIASGLRYSDRLKWKIPVTEPVKFAKRDLPVDPYILGCLIGDGGLSQGTPIITTSDKEILEKFQMYAENNNLSINHKSRYDYSISGKDHGCNNLTNHLRHLNLMGKTSHFKFIPEDYKYSSTEDRFALIKGLMDTDGCSRRGKDAEFSTVSLSLAKDFLEVIQSLGFAGKIKERITKCNNKNFKSFRVNISGNNINQLFSLNRKIHNTKRSKPNIFRAIKNIELVRQEKCQCIMVDHPDHLYLTDNFIVTHNTTTAMQLAFNCQKEGRPVIYINSEGRVSEMNFEVRGLDASKMQIITAEDTPLSAETFLAITLELISAKENEGALCIIDSVSSLIPAKDLDDDVTGMARPGLPKILSNFVKKAGQIVPNNKVLMVMITHLITNTSGYGPARMADSGVKIQYQADTRMEVKSVSPWLHGDDQVGQAVDWKIHYSSTGTTGLQCQSWIKYGEGIDMIQELMVMGEELALISKGGSWYTCDFLKDHKKIKDWFPKEDPKIQGQEKLYNFLHSTPEAAECLKEQIKGLLV